MSKKRVAVPEGYHCPFCPDHDDDDFFIWDLILDQPICHGCTYDLYYALLEVLEEKPLICMLTRLQELTGKSALESAIILVRHEIAYMEDGKNLEAKIANPGEFPTPTRLEIELRWQEDLAWFRSLLNDLQSRMEK